MDDNSPDLPDSADGTFEMVETLGKTHGRVRGLLRTENRGLLLSCIEAMEKTTAPFVAIMDADLQHDAAILPAMFEAVQSSDSDIAVGSRYRKDSIKGSNKDAWSVLRSAKRKFVLWACHLLVPAALNDPMSGFFLMRRSVFDEVSAKLSGRGFKILMDIFASSDRVLKFVEIPYTPRGRLHGKGKMGKSKLGKGVIWEFLVLLFEKSADVKQAIRLIPWALVVAAIALFHYFAD